ncbi:arginyl-tRNA synthetase [Mesoplasma entomophilum]|uniref:Arginine--tRNA ligase n=1 Tax=Mesoplasma entomophilum TaxID=2149 RepID=A0A3S5XZM4_9MOLU|nr:arginine--tRNA ligase [Mesoplasma entomophilum]ATQ35734.1 arginine--tRNA ligase [Mesoplasma entomophilum]ATZ19703.1 arginyl-tRNA synthetase [Mesoplasma entomophilum]
MDNIINIVKDDLKTIAKKINITKEPIVEINKNNIDSHFSTTLALMSAKELKQNPVQLAETIKQELMQKDYYDQIEIAGPGFINIKLKTKLLSRAIKNITTLKEAYGKNKSKNEIINIEYVSANPTGYLHVGHARNAVTGSVLEEVLKFDGYEVQTEYYTNDAGNQINILAVTVFVHYQWALGIEAEKPVNTYGGTFYDDLANTLIEKYGDKFKNLTFTETAISDDEVHQIFRKEATEYFLAEIKKQLKDFGVVIDHYSSEQEMYDTNQIEKLLEEYKEKNATYEADGALWLKTTEFGDDKDRVLIKKDGSLTYIVPDLATHNIRIDRTKADVLINIWGGDHHGYIQRMRAGLQLLGHNPDILEIEMVQMVRLIKDGQEYKMSKRKGTAVWLVDIMEMVGKDALRYMLASKSSSSHMDLDLDLVQQKNATNPVYYAQYATARCHSILNQAEQKNIKANLEETNLLSNKKEIELLLTLDNFNQVIQMAAKNRAPQLICEYIQTVCKQFHSYYADTKILDEKDLPISEARLGLVLAVLQVLTNAFTIIGVSALETM